jgi:hypothetical protein
MVLWCLACPNADVVVVEHSQTHSCTTMSTLPNSPRSANFAQANTGIQGNTTNSYASQFETHSCRRLRIPSAVKRNA